jgi:hypothetical protein
MLSSSEGKGGITIAVGASDNTLKEPRLPQTILIKSEYYAENNNLCKRVVVSQAAFKFDTTTSSITSLGAIEPTTRSVLIPVGECDGSWHLEIEAADQNWYVVDKTSGTTNSEILFTAGENYKTESRVAVLRVVSDRNSSLYKEVSITQSGFAFDNQDVKLAFSATENLEYRLAVGECYGGWVVAECPDWIEVSSTQDGAAIIKVQANGTSEKRQATIVLNSTYVSYNSALCKKILVEQDKVIEVETPLE